jgi:hypothetical protein
MRNFPSENPTDLVQADIEMVACNNFAEYRFVENLENLSICLKRHLPRRVVSAFQLLAPVSFVFRDKILKHIHTLKC